MAHRLSRKRCLDQCLPPLVQHVHWEPRQGGGGRRQVVAHSGIRAMCGRTFCILLPLSLFLSLSLCVCTCVVRVCVCVLCVLCVDCMYIHTYVRM